MSARQWRIRVRAVLRREVNTDQLVAAILALSEQLDTSHHRDHQQQHHKRMHERGRITGVAQQEARR